MKNIYKLLKNSVNGLIIAAIAFGIFTFVWKIGRIPSSSMEPTIYAGDIVIANGLAYINTTPQSGDIIIFKHRELGDEILIKRIIGIPGDSLMFVDGRLYINGELFQENYLPEGTRTDSFKDFAEIPENCYFVMGDNRNVSYDSRGWTDPYVQEQDIEGRMFMDIPFGKIVSNLREH